MILKKILTLICGPLMLLTGCGSEDPIKKEDVKDEPVVQKSDFKFKSYKRISPLSNLERHQIEKRSDIQEAGRNLLKSFDKNKSKINSSSQE